MLLPRLRALAHGPHPWQSRVPLAVQERDRTPVRAAWISRRAPGGARFKACHWHGHLWAVDGAAGSSTYPRRVQRTRGVLLALWRLPAWARDRVASTRSLYAEADQVDVAELPVIDSDLHRDPGESEGKLFPVPALEAISAEPHLEQIDGGPTDDGLETGDSTEGEPACGVVYSRLAQMRRRAAEQREVLTDASFAQSPFVWQVELPMASLCLQRLDQEIAAMFKGMTPSVYEGMKTLDRQKPHYRTAQPVADVPPGGRRPRPAPQLISEVGLSV